MSTLLADADLLYIYDGTLEGLLSAVFAAFERKEHPVNITTEQNLQLSLLASPVPVATNLAHAERVQAGIVEQLGQEAYHDVKCAFLSEDEHKGGAVLRYLQYTLNKGRRSRFDLAHPAVAELQQIVAQVSKEAHFMLQFLRFAQLQSGLYHSRIEPKASVVPLIMDHFAARFNVQPFVIHDARHGMAGVFDTSKWWLVDARELDLTSPAAASDASAAASAAQDEYQALWQTFYDTIAIDERRNPTCQRNFMPKRFWGNMCEHIPPELRKTRPCTQTPTQAAKQPKALPA